MSLTVTVHLADTLNVGDAVPMSLHTHFSSPYKTAAAEHCVTGHQPVQRSLPGAQGHEARGPGGSKTAAAEALCY